MSASTDKALTQNTNFIYNCIASISKTRKSKWAQLHNLSKKGVKSRGCCKEILLKLESGYYAIWKG